MTNVNHLGKLLQQTSATFCIERKIFVLKIIISIFISLQTYAYEQDMCYKNGNVLYGIFTCLIQ